MDDNLMDALRWHGRGDIRLDRLARPGPPGPGELLIRVEAAGICGTDIEEWVRGPINIATRPNPLTGRCAPLTLGHEFCGRVVSAGQGTTMAPGMLVGVEVNISCGACRWCLAGDTQLCPSLASLGLHGDGGLAELALVPESICVTIPDGLAPLDAVLAEPLAVAVRAVEHSRCARGDEVAVLGGGTIGLLVAQVVRARGASPVVLEPHERRRGIAEGMGLVAVHPDEARARPSGHHGADMTFECAGFPGAVRRALDLTRRGGTVMVLGVSESPIDVSAWDLIRDEQNIAGVSSHTKRDFETAIALLAEREVQVNGIVTDIVPLARAREDAFEALRNAPADHLKIVVTPNPRTSDVL